MKLERLKPEPFALLDFYESGLSALGAACARSWHDRLQVLAEGRAATLWEPDGRMVETELHFLEPDASGDRDAEREVFPGCPLTFRLVELLRPADLPLERVALRRMDSGKEPVPEVALRLWESQMEGVTRSGLEGEFKPAWHFSLVVLARCELQAIDQHWSLHRLVRAFPKGEADETLARQLGTAQVDAESALEVPWPAMDPSVWGERISVALAEELALEREAVRARQENYLRRELDRVDDFFEGYERELTQRQSRSRSEAIRAKLSERLAAARVEHERRRRDQVQRHEIRLVPHVDALLLTAEPAWEASLSYLQNHEAQSARAHFVPRARRWFTGP